MDWNVMLTEGRPGAKSFGSYEQVDEGYGACDHAQLK